MNLYTFKRWWIVCLLLCASVNSAQAERRSSSDIQEPACPDKASVLSASQSDRISSELKAEAERAVKNHAAPSAESDAALKGSSHEDLQPEAEDKPEERASLTLFEAEEYALAHSPTLQSSKYSAMVSHEQLGQWLANVYPDVSFSAGFTESGSLEAHRSNGIVKGSGRWTGGLSIKQNLLDFTRRPRLRKYELNELSALTELENTRQGLLLEVRRAWFTCYIDQELLDIAQDNVKNRQVRLEEAVKHYEIGTKAKSDVISARADLAVSQNEVIRAQTQLSFDWISLNVLIGKQDSEPYRLVLDPYWDDFAEADRDRLVAVAFANRPELLKLQTKLRSALADLEIIDAENYPNLSLNGSVGAGGTLSPLETSWSVGVSLNWSIFDGYLNEYQDSAQRFQILAIAQDFETERLAVYKEVCSAEVGLRQVKAAIASSESSLALAQEKYRLALARYKVGVGSSVEVSDAELTLAQAQTDYAEARNNLRLAKAVMIKSLGIEDMDNLPAETREIILDPLPEAPEVYDGENAELEVLNKKTSRPGE